ncbi:MAG: hypothetical protein QW616_05760 [Thermoplasmata archaeon]
MYLNLNKLIELQERKKVARVITEKHEKIEVDLKPHEKLTLVLIKEPFASYLKLLHWGATFNLDTIYKVYLNNDLIYIGTEPIQEDMDHEHLYDFAFANFITFEIINLSDTNTYKYFLDYYVKEIE